MVLALFVWKKFSCTSPQGLFPLGTLTSIFPFFFKFFSLVFFDSRDGFRRKEGTARGLLSISTLQEFICWQIRFHFHTQYSGKNLETGVSTRCQL